MRSQLSVRPQAAAPQRHPATLCRFHLQGYCRWGSNCVYVHDNPATAPGNKLDVPVRQSKPLCRFFAQGLCSKGEKCAFSHLKAHDEVVPAQIPPADSRSQLPCAFFAKGNCRNGMKCPFSHDGDATVVAGSSDDVSVQEQAEEKCTRELLGAWVVLGPGASIEKVSLASDFSTARIAGLPTGSNPAFVARLLSSVGLKIPETCIRTRAQEPDSRITADVRVQDPTFAKSLCDKYNAGEFKINDLSDVKVFALAVPASKGTAGFTHRVTCKKVVCSWHKPMCVALLYFDSEFLAKDICDRFSAGTYKVLGMNVSCSFRSTAARYRHGGDWRQFSVDPRPCVLTLRVPLGATTEDVLCMVPRGMMPRKVEFEGPQKVGKKGENRQLAMIEQLLTRVGPLEMKLTANMDAPGKRVKSMARFKDEADAKEAVRVLNKSRLPFNESDKLDVSLVYSATYKVATKVFEAVSEDVEAAEIAYREMFINFKSFPPANGYTTLRLEGENRQDLATAEKVVDGILRGETVTTDDGDRPFWSPSLGNRLVASKSLRRIEQEFQVAFHCIPSKAEIRVFGAPGKLKKARDALLKVFGGSPSTSHTILLDGKSFQWAIREGFQSLRDALGPENVALSILPTLKSIEILGPRSSYDLAVDIMSGEKTPSQPRSANQTDECCSVCWTEAEKPLTTKCGHIYCLDCFENFCQSADSAENGYRLRCLGDGGSCGVVFGLPELQEHLSSLTFEEILRSSAKSYVSKHPNGFRYCPTADCERIYRVTPPDRPGLYSCPGCLKATCSSCHFSHEGKSCAEHKYIASGGEKEFQQAKERLGIKDCPKCNTSIQKSEGCNHMTCRGCGAHICWVCLATFPTSGQCYTHLNREHGSVFPDEPLYNL